MARCSPGPGVFGPPRDPSAARAVLRRAIELGVDHIDTSQYYGPDVVNDLIRQALHPYPDNLKLVTKVVRGETTQDGCSPRSGPTKLPQGWRRTSAHFERSGWTSSTCAWLDQNVAGIALEEQLGALEDLRQEGKLDLIGLSNVDQMQVQRAVELVDVAEIQNLYNIIDRRDDELITFAGECEIAFVPFFPLAGGPAQLAADAKIVRVADKHGATPAQIALAWLLARYDRMLLIPGTNSISHLEENVAAIRLQLDDADLAALDHLEQRDDSAE